MTTGTAGPLLAEGAPGTRRRTTGSSFSTC